MDNKTKIILSVVGISAIIIPLVLLMYLSSKPVPKAEVSTGTRQIDANSVNKVVQSNQTKVIYASPSPSSPSARPAEGTRSAR